MTDKILSAEERVLKIIEAMQNTKLLRVYKIDAGYRDDDDYYGADRKHDIKENATSLGYWLQHVINADIALIVTDDGTTISSISSWEDNGERDYTLQNQPNIKYHWENDDGDDVPVEDVLSREKLSNVIDSVWVIENHPNLHLAGGLSWSMAVWSAENINILEKRDFTNE